MARRIAITTLGMLVASQLAFAQVGSEEKRLEEQIGRFLFPPNLVMRYQRQLELSQEQQQNIREKARDLTSEVVTLQWDLEDKTQLLIEILDSETVDVSAALQQIDQVLDIESQIKRRHLSTLIEIRNLLQPGQREQLREIVETLMHREGAHEGNMERSILEQRRLEELRREPPRSGREVEVHPHDGGL